MLNSISQRVHACIDACAGGEGRALPRMTGVVPTDCLIIHDPSAMCGMSFSILLRCSSVPLMNLRGRARGGGPQDTLAASQQAHPLVEHKVKGLPVVLLLHRVVRRVDQDGAGVLHDGGLQV